MPMFYYLVSKIGSGTDTDPFRPNYIGSYVWNPDDGYMGLFLMAIPVFSSSLTPVPDLQQACNERNLNIEDVQSWHCSG